MTVHLTVGPDALEVEITGWFDRTMCLSNGLSIPLTDITGARLTTWAEARGDLGWRTGGAYWPGLIATGWYSVPERKGCRQFWAVFRGHDQLLQIDTRLERPARLVISSEDRERIAWWINERVHPAS